MCRLKKQGGQKRGFRPTLPVDHASAGDRGRGRACGDGSRSMPRLTIRSSGSSRISRTRCCGTSSRRPSSYRRQIGDLPPDVGSRWMATDQIGPFRFHFVDELAELEPNRRVVWLSSAPWNARVEYMCTADGDRTRVRATYQGDVVGFLQILVGWLPTRAFGWIPRAGLPPAEPGALDARCKPRNAGTTDYPNGVQEPERADLFAGVDSGRPAPAE